MLCQHLDKLRSTEFGRNLFASATGMAAAATPRGAPFALLPRRRGAHSGQREEGNFAAAVPGVDCAPLEGGCVGPRASSVGIQKLELRTASCAYSCRAELLLGVRLGPGSSASDVAHRYKHSGRLCPFVEGAFCSGNFSSTAERRRSFPVRRTKYGAIVTATRDERDGPVETEFQKWTLEQLDEQLRILQEAESFASRRESEKSSDRMNGADEAEIKIPPQWPDFSFGFVAVTGVGLMVLTLVNNALYRIFFGPQVVDRGQVSAISDPPRVRFRVTSLEQEREARRMREEQQQQLAAQSIQAPSTLR